jgi:hypothetical protein
MEPNFESQPRELLLQFIEYGQEEDNVTEISMITNGGAIRSYLHPVTGGEVAVVWVGGAGGGVSGPAGGLYIRLARQLVQEKIASLRLDYRYANELDDCVLDTLMGVELLKMQGYHHIILIGHSFGGAVVITAGSMSEAVKGVAAMSSQTYGTGRVSQLSPRPLLLLHGIGDEVLPEHCSLDLYQRAEEPKTLILYPDCGHGLDECQSQVDRDLLNWLRKIS